MVSPADSAPGAPVGNGTAGLKPVFCGWLKLPPLPRPDGAPPLKIQSTPNCSWSVSFTSAIVTSIITWRAGTSSLRNACSMIEYSDGVAMTRIVFWSLSATTWMLRTTAAPSPPMGRAVAAAPLALATAVADGAPCSAAAAGVLGEIVGCVWNDGGETMLPAGVPGATLGPV